MQRLFDLADAVDILTALRHPREALRGIAEALLALPAIAILLVAAVVVIPLSGALAFLVVMGLAVLLRVVGLDEVVAPFLGIAIVLGTVIPPVLVMAMIYRRLPRRLRRALEPEHAALTPSPVEVSPREPSPSLGELDARFAPGITAVSPSDALASATAASRAGDASPVQGGGPQRLEAPLGAAVVAASTPRPGSQRKTLLEAPAFVAGVVLATLYAQSVGVIVGDGPLWFAELLMIAGATMGVTARLRGRERWITAGASAFVGTLALWALLFLGAG